MLAAHLILTAYGFWLPNDPRGSWSAFVRAWELRRFGEATTVHTRRSVAGKRHDAALRREAKLALARRPVVFNGEQARTIALAFGGRAEGSGYPIYACAVMPEHVHLVIGTPRTGVEKAAELLKGAATAAMIREGLHPFEDVFYRNGRRPTPWARKCWKVYLYERADVERAVRYVEENPVKEGKRRQKWSFVESF